MNITDNGIANDIYKTSTTAHYAAYNC